jgi:hypothetical protein
LRLRALSAALDPGLQCGDFGGFEAVAALGHGFFVLARELHAAEEVVADLRVTR